MIPEIHTTHVVSEMATKRHKLELQRMDELDRRIMNMTVSFLSFSHSFVVARAFETCGEDGWMSIHDCIRAYHDPSFLPIIFSNDEE